MKQNITTTEYNVVERNGQLKFTLNTEKIIPEDAPVRLTDAQLEELDYRRLYSAFSSKGRNPVTDPRVLFKVLAYASEIHVYSNRQIVDACENRIDMIWLLDGEPVPDQSTIARFKQRCAAEIEDLFYQYARLLEKQGETDHEVVFIDGTKIESRAGRYTFCWRGTVEKNLAKVKERVLKLTGLKTLLGLQKRLHNTKPAELVTGKGKHKSRAQREWEELESLRQRWEKYAEALEIMGESRNSYSKTDPDATFMRMKEDHMRNGQLKPAYNVQIAVNSEYITGIEVFSNRTDYGTLEPFLRGMEKKHKQKYKKVTADAGFESLDNYLYLEENGQTSFIKPQNHEIVQTKRFRSQIGRAENMSYSEEADTYTCAMGRTLVMYRESKDKHSKHDVVVSHYRCEDCTACPRREECCKAADPGKPKELRIRKQYLEKRAISEANISTEEGILLRICRSIQVEGAFGLLKNDFGFRRFLTTGKRNVRTELFLLGMGFNLKKLWKKRQAGRLGTHLSVLDSA
ncbi:MAG: IS1182 family transposase [Acidaminococcaceae bacterium]|nr:IS1182 family transposase [Acidaminococcaceae bacterium]